MIKYRDINEIKGLLRESLPSISRNYNVKSLGLFGSFVRNQQSEDSDVDILVVFHESPTLLRFIALENYLSDLLGIKVDLVMRDALKPRIGKRILEEVIDI
jgi:predicted nucleotidyltransferase